MIFKNFLLFILLCNIIGCGSVSNISKTFNQNAIIHNTNSINFFESHSNKTTIYIKVLNFTTAPELLAQSYLINHIGNDPKYHIVGSPEEADLIVEIKIMTIVPISHETIERLSKYWIYQSSTDHSIVDESGKLENNNTAFVIEESGFIMAAGSGKHDIKSVPKEKSNPVLDKNRADLVPGAVIGGSIAAIFGFNPSIISLGVIIGAGAGGILQELTSNTYKMSIIDITIKEKIKNPSPNITKTKYKNISSLSKNTIKEMYIENNSNNNVFIEHNTRISVISGSMAIMPSKIYSLTNYAIIQVISEILR